MKKMEFILGVTLISSTAFSSATMASAGLQLAQKSGCLACHAIKHNILGPAWMDVSKKYKGKSEITATLTDGTVVKGTPKDVLYQKIHEGGKGNWPVAKGYPMPAYSPKVSDANIARLVDFVLGLAK